VYKSETINCIASILVRFSSNLQDRLGGVTSQADTEIEEAPMSVVEIVWSKERNGLFCHVKTDPEYLNFGLTKEKKNGCKIPHIEIGYSLRQLGVIAVLLNAMKNMEHTPYVLFESNPKSLTTIGVQLGVCYPNKDDLTELLQKAGVDITDATVQININSCSGMITNISTKIDSGTFSRVTDNYAQAVELRVQIAEKIPHSTYGMSVCRFQVTHVKTMTRDL